MLIQLRNIASCIRPFAIRTTKCNRGCYDRVRVSTMHILIQSSLGTTSSSAGKRCTGIVLKSHEWFRFLLSNNGTIKPEISSLAVSRSRMFWRKWIVVALSLYLCLQSGSIIFHHLCMSRVCQSQSNHRHDRPGEHDWKPIKPSTDP